MKTNRRDFIKISGLGLGGAFLSYHLLDLQKGYGKVSEEEVPFTKTPTVCELCFWKCAGWVHTDADGSIQKLTGNAADPHCNGKLCPRGTGGIGQYYDEDRLKTPLIRVEEGGKQTFREASWDEALDYIAQKMKQIKAEHGAESMALISHASGGSFLGELMKAYGSTNKVAPSYSQCRGPREAGFLATFGSGVYSPEPTDIRDTRCLVLIGSHIGENMHNGQVQEFAEAVEKGATIITVDPRFSIAAGKSKYWLAIKPATDIALLLAWMNVIISEKLYDREYVEQYTYGFDQLKAHVAPYTPEWAYGITTIRPEKIRATAREMAAAAPATIIHPGRHVTWYGDDSQRSRAIAILNALLGSWGRPGGFFFPTYPEKHSFPHPEYPKPQWTWKDTTGGKYPLANEGVVNAVIDASLPDSESEYKIKGWIVNGSNLPVAVPDLARTEKAIAALDLLVVIDTMPMDITGYADVVLPECTYLERHDDLRFSTHREASVALRMPAAEPKYNSKPAWWMTKQLASKLGLGAFFPWKDIEEKLDWELKQVGTSLEEMKETGVKRFKRPADDPIFIPEGMDWEFATPSGKIEFYSNEFLAAGFAPLPDYTPHPEPPPGFYRLNYGRAPVHTFSRTTNNPNLHDLMEENTLWVHPQIAKEWGLRNGSKVWLENQDGIVSDFPIKVRVTQRTRWDSVYMVHGFGSINKKLSRASARGASDTQLITDVKTDPVMGGTGMRGNFVSFRFEPPQSQEI